MDLCVFSPLLKPVTDREGEWATERHTEWESVGTDLFLLNSSRFNQQIIDLIKWHPLLGQEPARSMRISQAKIKIHTPTYSHEKKKFFTPTIYSTTFTITICLMGPPWSRSDSTHSTHSPATKSKYRQRWKDETNKLSQSAKSNTQVCSESKQKKAKAPKPEQAQCLNHE